MKHRKVNDARIRLRNSQITFDYLKFHPCVDCGESDPFILEFDHVSGLKKESISNLAKRRSSVKKIIDEIAKCEVRCANCHRRKTAKELGWYAKINFGRRGVA